MPDPALRYDHFEIVTDDAGRPCRLGGQSGMGMAFVARDTQAGGRRVVLKLIQPQLVSDATVRRRFFNEAKAAARVSHPNVATVFYVCHEDAPECFYAMEFVEGETLKERILHRGPMPAREALFALRAVADALTALGQHGVVHRDIKPDNIMIAIRGPVATRVKLIDFGLVKPLVSTASLDMSVSITSGFLGSYHYASPEQTRPKKDVPVDCRSDFYSLGVTLWHALAGLPPFLGDTPFEVQSGHVFEDPPWEKIAAEPEPLLALLRRLLAKNPADRPADADALLAEWDAAIEALQSLPEKNQAAPAPVTPLVETPTVPHEEPAPTEPAALPHWQLTDPADGFAAPPAPALLALHDEKQRALRELPPSLPGDLRAAVLDAVRRAEAAPHASFLNIAAVAENAVLSEWQPGISCGRLLARQGGALPLPLLRAWLPVLADAADHSLAHGLATGYDPALWLVQFDTLPTGTTPESLAAQPVSTWPAHYVLLDPLAAWDATLARHTDTARTIPTTPASPLTTLPEVLAALARALCILVGSRPTTRFTPQPTFNEPANDLLRTAIERTAPHPSVAAWAAAFAQAMENMASPATSSSAPAPAPIATPELENPVKLLVKEHPIHVSQKPQTSQDSLAWFVLLLAAVVVVVFSCFDHLNQRNWNEAEKRAIQAAYTKQDIQDREQISSLLNQSETALARGDISTAEARLFAATAVKNAVVQAALTNRVAALLKSIETGKAAEKKSANEIIMHNPQYAAMKAAEAKRLEKNSVNPSEKRIVVEREPVANVDAEVGTTSFNTGRIGATRDVHLGGGVKITFCYIPATTDPAVKELFPNGTFKMGSPASEEGRGTDENQVDVKITRGFWLAQTEMSQAQWAAAGGKAKEEPGFKGGDLPVENVNWKECDALMKKLNASLSLPTGWEWALPTEAQWEYACRAGATTPFNIGGKGVSSLTSTEANFNGEYPYGAAAKGVYRKKTVSALPRTVDSFRANSWGLYHMHGNMFEWCADYYADTLVGGKDPGGAEGDVFRVLRSGGWTSSGNFCRSAKRDWYLPQLESDRIGFRPAIVPSSAGGVR